MVLVRSVTFRWDEDTDSARTSVFSRITGSNGFRAGKERRNRCWYSKVPGSLTRKGYRGVR
ncbi:hypothetical protein BTHE_1853 [Bifidobacterium thermophilum]|nr:hypothetical protein BTHE_1853 [Bifidobacterium thermophilum]